MNENDPISRPSRIEPEIWYSIPPGSRIRLLRRIEDTFPLDPEQYFELRRLPYWTCYEPEDGLPAEWFNRRGFLLPMYRPGGSRHELFRRWRRQYRVRRYIHRAVVAGLRAWWRMYREWVWGALIVLYGVTGIGIQNALRICYGEFAAGGLYFGGFILMLALYVLLVRPLLYRQLGPLVVRQCTEWRIRKAFRRTEGCDNGGADRAEATK